MGGRAGAGGLLIGNSTFDWGDQGGGLSLRIEEGGGRKSRTWTRLRAFWPQTSKVRMKIDTEESEGSCRGCVFRVFVGRGQEEVAEEKKKKKKKKKNEKRARSDDHRDA